MPVVNNNFTTGPATLPDVGVLSYNGCVFSPLYETKVSGAAVKDNAQRTVKYIVYTITADGYVTLPAGAESIAPTMTTLRTLLTTQGGELVYQGRGCDIVVNPQGGNVVFGPKGAIQQSDVAWGPVPEMLDFQPLGGGNCAKIHWAVKVRIPEITRGPTGILQFNYDTDISYAEDGYSTISVHGTLEIPLTRIPNQATRTVPTTADAFRSYIDKRIMSSIDLSRFRVTRRNFNTSRDKRTLEWDFSMEEKPYMDLPPACTIARGTYNVRPAQAGMGLCTWLCTLRATYTVRADQPRRLAWAAFLALLRVRMAESVNSNIPNVANGDQNPNARLIRALTRLVEGGHLTKEKALDAFKLILKKQADTQNNQKFQSAWIIDFSFDEGMYLDSKTTGFSATWRLVTTFSNILQASGLWKTVFEGNGLTGNLWAASVRDISGTKSWLPNQVDPTLDIIVDFGS